MVLLDRVKKAAIVCAVLLFIGQQGCASKPVKSPILAQPSLSGEKIGVVIKRAPEGEGLKIPAKGVGGSLGRGAIAGAGGGAYIGQVCGPLAILCMPALAVLGAVGGAFTGGVASEGASKWEDAEAIFRACLAEQDFDDLLETRLISLAQETGCPLQSINGIETSVNEPIDYKSFSHKGIGLVLELSEITTQLRGADWSINNPSLLFFTSVRAKLFRTNDWTLLDDRVIADDMGETHPRDEWAFDDGTAFREELSRAAQRMAEMIVTDLFLPPSPGPRPIHPPVQYSYNKGSPLQPTFRWEPYQGENVTYDLKIWLSGREGSASRLVYSREGLPEEFHTLETPLQSNTPYDWTVRARYTSGGLTRMTEWTIMKTFFGTRIYYPFFTK